MNGHFDKCVLHAAKQDWKNALLIICGNFQDLQNFKLCLSEAMNLTLQTFINDLNLHSLQSL